MDLQEENKKLKEKLAHAQEWMQREIQSCENNIQEDIESQIFSFFSPEALSYFPTHGLENIISAEIVYRHLLSWEQLDGMWVVLWYQKVIDGMIEMYITKWFRKYLKKNNINPQYLNDPLEKSLRAIVEKKYIFSLWRVYQSLKLISENQSLTPYIYELSAYIKSRPTLKKSLLQSSFLLQLEWLIHLHAISDKRHSGTLSRTDTLKARKFINWNFQDKECILSLLSASQDTVI